MIFAASRSRAPKGPKPRCARQETDGVTMRSVVHRSDTTKGYVTVSAARLGRLRSFGEYQGCIARSELRALLSRSAGLLSKHIGVLFEEQLEGLP